MTDKFVTCTVERSGHEKKEAGVQEKKPYENDWEVKPSNEARRELTGVESLRKLGNVQKIVVAKAQEYDRTALICAGVAITLLFILICGVSGNRKTTPKKSS